MARGKTDRQTDRETHTDSPERVTYDAKPTDEWYENVLDEEANERHGWIQVLWDTRSVTVVVQSIVYKTR